MLLEVGWEINIILLETTKAKATVTAFHYMFTTVFVSFVLWQPSSYRSPVSKRKTNNTHFLVTVYYTRLKEKTVGREEEEQQHPPIKLTPKPSPLSSVENRGDGGEIHW